MQVINRKRKINYDPQAFGTNAAKASISKIEDTEHIQVYELSVPKDATKEILTIQWKAKALGIKGAWTSNNILDKRFRTDWEMPKLKSSISVDAPVINLFGYSDENILTIGCSDLINLIDIEASLREEDNHFYFKLHFFIEAGLDQDYQTKIYLNKKPENFGSVIQGYADWAIEENKIEPMPCPELATQPLYSTWYSFHQELDTNEVIKECKAAKKIGYELVVIDDGWQTKDDGRGYDFTGDWKPERIPEMKHFVSHIHDIGMGIMLWYSVPFCGRKSEAYKNFQGKFLTENHYWAPVFDPRFPEVRAYLIGLYAAALKEWNIDGFKLDFIDDFKVYPDTEVNNLNGRDTLSVAQGVKKLIEEIASTLKAIKPDVLIEFRQQYINPSLRVLGNMFRAFDCPNDSLMNRVRTTDVKLLCGDSAPHSDMITWHKDEPVEIAALQLSSIMFSVPQLSVRVTERTAEEVAMIKFYTEYWTKHKHILLGGNFNAYKPLSNYPYLSATNESTTIYGIYEDVLLPINTTQNEIHIINGKMSSTVAIQSSSKNETWERIIYDCKGDINVKDTFTLDNTFQTIECPPNGIITLSKK